MKKFKVTFYDYNDNLVDSINAHCDSSIEAKEIGVHYINDVVCRGGCFYYMTIEEIGGAQ